MFRFCESSCKNRSYRSCRSCRATQLPGETMRPDATPAESANVRPAGLTCAGNLFDCRAGPAAPIPCRYPHFQCVRSEKVACFRGNHSGECLTRANGEDEFSVAPRRWLGLNKKSRFLNKDVGNDKPQCSAPAHRIITDFYHAHFMPRFNLSTVAEPSHQAPVARLSVPCRLQRARLRDRR